MPASLVRAWMVLAISLLAVALVAPVGLAQEIGEPEPEPEERLHELGVMPIPNGVLGNQSELWVWPEGRLGYMASGTLPGVPGTVVAPIAPDGLGLVAIDLDTFAVAADTGCSTRPACKEPVEDGFPHWIHQGLVRERGPGIVIDRENEVLYVAHHNALGYGSDGDLLGGDLTGDVDPSVANATLCHPERVLSGVLPCFAGVYVLDARTLEVVRDIPFFQVGLDASGVQLALQAMSYSPHPGSDGKLHMLLQEDAHAAVGVSSTVHDARGRLNQHYAAQIDVASGRTDWVVRVSSCLGSRGGQSLEGPFGAIFRSPDPGRPVVWVGCWGGGSRVSSVVRLNLDAGAERAVVSQQPFVAPGGATAFRADPASERIFVKTALGEALWWVFDGHEGGFVSRVGIGPDVSRGTGDGVDPSSGRLYTFAGDLSQQPRGLGWVDGRRAELPQYTWDPSVAHRFPTGTSETAGIRISVDAPVGERPRRVLLKPSSTSPFFVVLDDPVPITADPLPAQDDARSDDVPEREGATSATFTGSARGYGTRMILVSGLNGITGFHGAGGGTPEGMPTGPELTAPECRGTQRALAFALAGSPERSERAEIDALGSASATAQATYADPTTEDDLDAPYNRCRPRVLGEWNEVVRGVRTGQDEPSARPPGSDPDDSPMRGATRVSCAAPERNADEAADPIFTGLTAEVSCGEGVVSAVSRARLLGVGPVDVAEAGSTYRVEARPGGSVAARVESWARGVTIVGDEGMVTIDAIRSVATAWANGRAQPGDGVGDPNCDTSRTAGSCFQRFLSGGTVIDASGETVFSCEPCGDPDNFQQFAGAMQSALGSGWLVSAPEPDPDFARGAADGAQVAVLKRPSVMFADQFLKGDLLPTLPALELVRVSDVPTAMGRQVFQFAGVEIDLSYAITCLLTIVDGECVGEPASLAIELSDVLGVPLPGGAFEVHEAGDDGLLDLESSLGDPLVCVTGPDGSCGFDEIAPGAYVVQQVAAPDGYIPMVDQTIDLPAGGHGTLSVVNGTLPVTGIAITLTDLDGDALEGGEFEVHVGETAADGAPALATCATDEIGVCRFPTPAVPDVEVPLPLDLLPVALPDPPEGLLQVPAGGYTVRQASAPEGYEPVDDIFFELPDGEVARVTLSNAPPWLDDEFAEGDAVAVFDTDTGVTEQVSFAQSPPVAEPAFHVEFPEQPDLPMAAPGDADDSLGRQMLMLPGEAARFALRHPKEALAFGGVLLLFAAAAAGAYRRRFILELLGS